MTTVIPQHMVALERANRHRSARADLKHQVTTGEVLAADVILSPPAYTLSMPVAMLLRAQYQWGPDRARRLLVVAQVRESKTLGSLTDRQRRVLADLLTWGTA